MTNEQDEIMTEAQAAEYLSVKPRTIRAWRMTRKLPYLKLTARTLRYKKSKIDEWLTQFSVKQVEQ